MLPMIFASWINPLSWILNLEIVVDINACGFLSNDNHSPTNGIRGIVIEFETQLIHVGGEIVGHWVQCFLRVS
jgi:hypothetical protein